MAAFGLAPASLKIGGAILVAVALFGVTMFHLGKREGRKEVEADAATSALARVMKMEKNNAQFKIMPGRDRCLLLAADSGLPDSACD